MCFPAHSRSQKNADLLPYFWTYRTRTLLKESYKVPRVPDLVVQIPDSTVFLFTFQERENMLSYEKTIFLRYPLSFSNFRRRC